MTTLLGPAAWAVLADIELFRGMGSSFRGKRARIDSDDLLAWLGIAVGVALAMWTLSRLLARQERFRRCTKPWPLFRALCQAHRLRRRDRRLLARLARHQALVHPAQLFVEPWRLEPGGLPAEFTPQAPELEALRQRLFRWPEERPAPPSAAGSAPQPAGGTT